MKLNRIVAIALLTCSVLLVTFIVKLNDFNKPDVLKIDNGQFELASSEGPWSLKDHAKAVNFVYFGFTRCPDVCPMAMAYIGQALKEMSESDRENANFIFVSVDYERDTPASAAQYASHFGAQVVGLTGNESQIKSLSNQYKFITMIEKQPESLSGMTVSHPNRIYVLDKNLKVVESISPPTSHEQLLEAYKKHASPHALSFLANLFD